MFPSMPSTADDWALAQLIGQTREEFDKGQALLKENNGIEQSWMCQDGTRRYAVTMASLRQAVANEKLLEDLLTNAAREKLRKNGEYLTEEPVSVGGKSVPLFRLKMKSGKAVLRCFFVSGDRAIDLVIIDDADIAMDDQNTKKFIEKFQFKRTAPTANEGGRGRTR
jgi:hypothetical protein